MHQSSWLVLFELFFSLFYLCYLFNYRTMLNNSKLIIVCCAVLSLRCVQATSPPQFLKDINGYRSACKSIGWEPKQGKSPFKILTHKPCYCFVVLLSHNNEIQIFYIVLYCLLPRTMQFIGLTYEQEI